MPKIECMNKVSRILPLLICACATAVAHSAYAFGLEDVEKQASALAKTEYNADNVPQLPQDMRNLSKEDNWKIFFKDNKALWGNDHLPFDVTFVQRGGGFVAGVKINQIVDNKVSQVDFNPDMFDFGNLPINKAGLENKNLGFAGFRIRFPLNGKHMDDALSFQGASYFRGLGKNQWYGLSTRGIAVDTALPSGEEFPRFTEFWIEKPKAKSKSIKIYALLNSPSLTGAYEFIYTPGVTSDMDVKAKLFMRKNIAKLGIAPLTSMFFYGANQRPRHNDYRPEAHDSDGLLMHFDNEWIWRPLVNPKKLLVTSFSTTNPKGFGLMQRNHNYKSYDDIENNYQDRPSGWVTPKGDWGKGRVELVQIPTLDETNDNMVAYWVSDKEAKAGDSASLAYQISWHKDKEVFPPLASVVDTRLGEGFVDTPVSKKDGNYYFVVDFKSNPPIKLDDKAAFDAIYSTDDNGQIVDTKIRYNKQVDGWRVELVLHRNEDSKPVELRLQLQDRKTHKPISETWSYLLPAN